MAENAQPFFPLAQTVGVASETPTVCTLFHSFTPSLKPEPPDPIAGPGLPGRRHPAVHFILTA